MTKINSETKMTKSIIQKMTFFRVNRNFCNKPCAQKRWGFFILRKWSCELWTNSSRGELKAGPEAWPIQARGPFWPEAARREQALQRALTPAFCLVSVGLFLVTRRGKYVLIQSFRMMRKLYSQVIILIPPDDRYSFEKTTQRSNQCGCLVCHGNIFLRIGTQEARRTLS